MRKEIIHSVALNKPQSGQDTGSGVVNSMGSLNRAPWGDGGGQQNRPPNPRGSCCGHTALLGCSQPLGTSWLWGLGPHLDLFFPFEHPWVLLVGQKPTRGKVVPSSAAWGWHG